ncbi:MAG: DUF1614 domain-containing protein [Conexivisphaera sp.]
MGKRVVVAPPAHPGVLGALLLILVVPILLGIVLPRALEAALSPLGIPGAAPLVLLLIAASPFLAFLNLVIRRREVRAQVLEIGYVSVFGIPFPVARPRWTSFESLLAVNVGGALVPVSIATLMAVAGAAGPRGPEFLASIAAATAIVAAITYRSSRVIGGVGIVVPTFVPPLASLASALASGGLLGLWPFVPAISYAGAVYGTLIGADVANLVLRGDEIAAWLVSIGGAGTFDGIFVSGIISMILSALIV